MRFAWRNGSEHTLDEVVPELRGDEGVRISVDSKRSVTENCGRRAEVTLLRSFWKTEIRGVLYVRQFRGRISVCGGSLRPPPIRLDFLPLVFAASARLPTTAAGSTPRPPSTTAAAATTAAVRRHPPRANSSASATPPAPESAVPVSVLVLSSVEHSERGPSNWIAVRAEMAVLSSFSLSSHEAKPRERGRFAIRHDPGAKLDRAISLNKLRTPLLWR